MTTKYNLSLLASIAAATVDPGYGMFTENDELAALVNDGLVATNAQMRENGNIAAMLTDAGKKFHSEASANGGEASKSEPAKEKQTFGVSTMKRPEPVKRTREGGGSKYPFDKLELPNGDNVSSFFVPATEDMPDPAKSLTSAVSQANRSYGKVVGKNARGHDVYEYTRVFRIQPSDDPKGAYVWRDADNEPGKAETDDEAAEGAAADAKAANG